MLTYFPVEHHVRWFLAVAEEFFSSNICLYESTSFCCLISSVWEARDIVCFGDLESDLLKSHKNWAHFCRAGLLFIQLLGQTMRWDTG